MAMVNLNNDLFNYLVECLENRELKSFSNCIKKENAQHLDNILTAKDRRRGKYGHYIKEYRYRYRKIPREGHTLLHYAMIFGDKEVVTTLLDLRADPMATTQATDPTESSKQTDGSFTVVHCPCYIGNCETLEALLSYKDHPMTKENVNELVSKPYQHTFVDGKQSKWKWTPLHYACGRNNTDVVNLLLRHGADPLEDNGQCLRYASKVSKYDIVKLLVDFYLKESKNTQDKKKDKLKSIINEGDDKKLTALHYACQKKCVQTVKLLLEHGGDPIMEDTKGHIPLYFAITGGAEECAITLLHTKELCPVFLGGKKFLTSEIFSNLIHQDMAKVMIKILHFCETAYNSLELKNALHEAVCSDAFSSEEFVQVVKGLGKDSIEEKDEDSLTPMMLAASQNMHRKLHMMFHAYIELLDENMYFSDKNHYKHLYTNIVANKDKKGQSMAHLAVRCNGSDSAFEDTVKVLEEIYKMINSMEGMNDLPIEEKDPFSVACKCPEDLGEISLDEENDNQEDEEVSALELAFRSSKPERAIVIIEITKGRTLRQLDNRIIHSALQSGIQTVDFDRLTKIIIELQEKETIMDLFNSVKCGLVPLHLAFTKKQFPHAKILIKLEVKKDEERYNAVKLVTRKTGPESSLDAALTSGSPINIIQTITKSILPSRLPVDTIDGNANPQLMLPLKGVEPLAIKLILTSATPKLQEQHRTAEVEQEEGNFLNNLLDEAVRQNSRDVFEMMIVEWNSIFLSTLKLVILDKENEEFARLIVRYSNEESLLKKLTTVVSTPTGKTIMINELIQKMPDVALEALQRSTKVDQSKLITDNTLLLECGVHPEQSNPREFEMEPGMPTATPKDVAHPLDLMVDSKQKELLQHPLVKCYLHREWQAFGFWIYFFQIFIYFVFLAVFSTLVQTVQHPIEEQYSMKEFSNVEKFGVKADNAEQSALSNRISNGTNKVATYALSSLSFMFLLIQSIYSGIIAVIQLKKKATNSLKFIGKILTYTPEILLQVPTFILVVVFSSYSIYYAMNDRFHSKAIWRVGIFATIFGWSNLVLLGSKLPTFGEYALIFMNILKTFIKLAIFGFILVMASTIVLRMIFYDPVELSSPFFTFGGSIVKLITMVTGEIDFQDTFSFSFAADDEVTSRNLYDRTMAYFVWIVFLIVIPIILSNMLIALAVGDANEIHENASITKLKLLAYWVTTLQGRKKYKKPNVALYVIDKLSAWFKEESAAAKKEKRDVQLYHKRREEEMDEIKAKYSKEVEGTDDERIQTIQEVAISSQNKLREMKVSHDVALQKVQSGQVHLMKNLGGLHQES